MRPMQAWVVQRPGPVETGPLRAVEREVPEPGPAEVRVRVRACGVCRTDLHLAEGDLAPIAEKLAKANGELKAATMWFMQNAMANPNHLGAGAYAYMTLLGTVAVALMWLKMARVATAALAGGTDNRAFYEAKLTTARYFAERHLPDCGALRRKIEGGADSVMALPVEAFATAA